MRVVFAGTPEAAVPSLDALLASSHEVVAVLTRPDAPSGRGRTLRASPVKERALKAGVPVLAAASAKDPELATQLGRLRPDVCAVVAYGQILPRALLDVPSHGWVNLHFSLLPAWRGAAPVQRALIAGDDVTGATTFVIEEGLDSGPVLGTMTEEVRPADTAGALLDRLARAGAGLLMATLDAVQDGLAEPVPQPLHGVTLAPKVTVEDARLRWNDPASGVDRRIRGCTPAPGAWAVFRGQRVKLGPVRPLAPGEAREVVPPGRLLVTRHEVLAGTATTPVRLGEIQAPGKQPMPAPDWARGARIEPGEGFALDGVDST